MSNKGYLIFVLAVIFAAVFFAIGYDMGCGSGDAPHNDTIFVESHDTIVLNNIEVVKEEFVKYKTIALTDTIVKNDTIYAEIPITQRWYHEDSLCDVWVSGYEPVVDSIQIVQKHTTEIIREQITSKEMPRFNAEVGIGGLYLQDRLVGSVGAEVRYNAANLTYKIGAGYTTEKKPIFGVGIAYRIDL